MTRKIALITLALGLTLSVNATEVTPSKAADVAKLFMMQKVDAFYDEVKDVKTVTYEGEKAYYIVQFYKGGWVMVSADDKSKPIIGYSPTDHWPSEVDMPENFRGMLNCYAEELLNNKHFSSTRHPEWESKARAAMTRASVASDEELKEPLIKVNWAQGSPYKKYCPKDNKGQAVVGCVAVGMAQAMSVAKWPERPNGQFGYTSANYGSLYIDYDKEPDYNWTAILNGANGYDDVARLLWHCGVSIRMDYSPNGSGTQTSNIPGALQLIFGYPASVKYYSRDSYKGDWTELILNELRQRRAVVYSGYDSKGNYGHCFNIDAYDGNMFHVNWGWGASYNQNSWFLISNLHDPNMKMDYDAGHGVVVGIRRPSQDPMNITLSALEVQAGQPAGTYVADVEVESEAVNPVYSYTLKGKYSARQHTYLEAPFEVVDNKLLTTKELSVGTQQVTITATNMHNQHSYERTFYITVTTDPVGIKTTTVLAVEPKQFFSPTGVQLSTPGKGLNIIHQRMSDGTKKTVKVFMK